MRTCFIALDINENETVDKMIILQGILENTSFDLHRDRKEIFILNKGL